MIPPSSSDPRHRTTVFGLLGGIASGKSEVARLLAGEHGIVLSADQIAREALESHEIQEHLCAEFGPEALGPEGHTDRQWVAERVFSDPSALRRLEGWIHPLVRARISTELERAREQGIGRVVLDVPLLLENDAQHHFTNECDVLIFVDVALDERERRARERRGWQPGELARREALQLPLEHKKRRADIVLSNHGSLADLASAVQLILNTTPRGLEP